MKILHTSDWHLGRRLYGRNRTEEFQAFLNWLLEIVEKEQIELLLVAGDIFDSGTPGNTAQRLYYDFLCRAATLKYCRNIVVIGGNHDSPSFLEAPKDILKALNVYVVGCVGENPEDEVIVLTGVQGYPELIVCAVPFLRDRDVRLVEAGESGFDKTRKLVEGIEEHYRRIVRCAVKKREELEIQGIDHIPIIAMGHLFTSGGMTCDGDGVRDLYVGSLAQVGGFPAEIDYLALGHLHVPQEVAGCNTWRYCGSPISMGFGEANQEKRVIVVECGQNCVVREIPIPVFQRLESIAGNLPEIERRLHQLVLQKISIWVEIEFTGTSTPENLREILYDIVTDSPVEIRRIKNRQMVERILQAIDENETLEDLSEQDVFLRCLEAYAIPDEDYSELQAAYNEILQSIHEEDRQR